MTGSVSMTGGKLVIFLVRFRQTVRSEGRRVLQFMFWETQVSSSPKKDTQQVILEKSDSCICIENTPSAIERKDDFALPIHYNTVIANLISVQNGTKIYNVPSAFSSREKHGLHHLSI